MTKSRDVIRKIKAAAQAQGLEFELAREGGNHSVFKLGGLPVPIARHNEIGDRMAEAIYRECAEKLGKDWWK